MSFYYMSFCNNALPEGQRFIGATVVEAKNPKEALERATALGVNPGGEVMMLRGEELPSDSRARTYLNRFVPRDEVMAEPHDIATLDRADAFVCQSHNPWPSRH